MVEEGNPFARPAAPALAMQTGPGPPQFWTHGSCVDAGLHGVDSRLASLKC